MCLENAPGPTRASAFPILASAFEGGARLESTAAAKTALNTNTTSPLTSRRRRTAAPAAHQDRPAGEVDPVRSDREPARRGLGCVAGEPGDEQAGRGGADRPREGEQLGDRARRPLGPVEPERDRRGDAEERERELEVEEPPPERGGAQEREDAGEVGRRPQRELRRREVEVDGDRDEREDEQGPERDR